MKIHGAMALTILIATAAVAAGPDPAAGVPLPAQWVYSVDSGKTFAAEAPTIGGSPSPTGKPYDAAKAEFTIADPANIGILKITAKSGRGAFALTDANSVDRYNVGAAPAMLETKILLNGKPTDLGHAPNTLYRYLVIEPSTLKNGANTLELAGQFWHKHPNVVPCDLQLEVIPPDRAVLDRLPILGMIGEDYFGVACRAVIPSRFTVAVTPLEPAGAETKHSFGPARQLKAKVPLPKATKTFRYTVTVAAGGAAKSYGPYECRAPRGGPGFRFIAAGGTATTKEGTEGVEVLLAKVRDARADLFLHTGNYQNCPTWDFKWTEDFLRVAQPTFASLPMFAAANISEMVSPDSFGRTFFFSPDDDNWAQWTVAVGNVRFIAVEAFGQSLDNTDAGVKWLDQVLRNAKEDYVLVLNAHAAECAPVGAGKLFQRGAKHTAAKIDPLLSKYKVTTTIGNMYRGYQRIEPPPGEGVPTVLTGKLGGYIGLNWKITLTREAQTKAKSTDEHFVLFEVKSDCLEMKTLGRHGNPIDSRTFQPRK